jgi:hypothetical protein
MCAMVGMGYKGKRVGKDENELYSHGMDVHAESFQGGRAREESVDMASLIVEITIMMIRVDWILTHRLFQCTQLNSFYILNVQKNNNRKHATCNTEGRKKKAQLIKIFERTTLQNNGTKK